MAAAVGLAGVFGAHIGQAGILDTMADTAKFINEEGKGQARYVVPFWFNKRFHHNDKLKEFSK